MESVSKKADSGLREIKKRLRAGKLTASDIKRLEKIVIMSEQATKALRAAIVE